MGAGAGRSFFLIGAITFVVACPLIAIARKTPTPPYPKSEAVAAAQRDPNVRAGLSGRRWTRTRVIPLDAATWHVGFFNGPRIVLDAAVDSQGRVIKYAVQGAGHPPGSTTLWQPWLLILLSALFVAAVAARPARLVRNLDAVVVGGAFTTSALLIDDRLVAAHVFAGAAGVAYIAIRCARIAFGPTPAEAAQPASLERFIRPIAVAVLVAGWILIITSTGISDVAFAGLLGGTLLNHGTSPYGHLPAEILHGDTYPLLTYMLYMPFAAISPVRNGFDSLDGSLWLNAIAVSVAALIFFRRWGTRTTLAWLAFPPVLIAATAGGNDVPAAVFVVAALATYGRERATAGLLTLAGWVKIIPAVALIPLVARLRGAALIQTLAVVVALVAAGLALMLAFGGTEAIDLARTGLRFQVERGSWYSVWRQLDAPAVQVVLQALTVSVAVVAALYAARNPELSLRRFAAIAGTLLALIQLSGNYWTYAYLPWLIPFVLLALFPPVLPRSRQSEPHAP